MQKIVPHLWFDNNVEEAINYYLSIFPNSQIIEKKVFENSGPNLDQTVVSAHFSLNGYEFMAINGGPEFKFNPSISFFVECKSEEEVTNMFNKLSEGGQVLMPLDKYPFNEKYGWISDKYGVSWQVILGDTDHKITPSLLFTGAQNGRAEEAINFYVSLFDDSHIEIISRYEAGEPDKEGNIKYSKFILAGQEFSAMESGLDHKFSFNEAVSLFVNCEDQEEVDKFWNSFTEEGEESQCGWLKDKFGVSWQIVPQKLNEILSDPDPVKAQKAMKAMLQMKKLDIAELEKAKE